ncbi:hypothetical protein [Sporosarcina sp. Te-1]|uniref:hypothetical protein n=1 Tax=Sporosarcina sp. Te-1 TaxID=2818390 RepID=UPI001A9FA9DF|nr:hypothetical protein [Sporosarcina sp. Te-1]QTD40756.1 hypothetical protein J3U78_18685 [Sporosarcina sp. Te-1]
MYDDPTFMGGSRFSDLKLAGDPRELPNNFTLNVALNAFDHSRDWFVSGTDLVPVIKICTGC